MCVIAATVSGSARSARTRYLREDLRYRLNVVLMNIPPLRERKEDIPYLVDEAI